MPGRTPSVATTATSRFGLLLRHYRLAAGWTQEQLAEQAAMSAQGISNLERGIRLPYRHTLQQLADALHLTEQERMGFLEAGRAVAVAETSSSSPPVPSPPLATRSSLVGRARELDLLHRHLLGTGPPVLFFAGEPGIGKTSLLQEAEIRGRGSGLAVLAGGCQRWSSQEPYAPILEALERFIQELEAGDICGSLQGCSWLVRLLPELTGLVAEPPPGATLAPETERRLIFRAVQRFLANVAGPAGALLVLDDLHWAGSDALDLLAALARGHPSVGAPLVGAPLRVVGAYRDTDVAALSPLHAMLADLAHGGLVEQVALSGLSEEEAAALLDRLLEGGTPLAESIIRRADGVPFFLVSCAQGVRAGTLREESPEGVPWDLAETLRQRIAALPVDAQTVLGVAAVAGRVVELPLLLTATGLAESVVVEALEAACRARLLEEVGADYRFVHDVIREVVEADLGAAGRAVLHRQVGESLERAAAIPAELLAYHYARSGAQDKAIQYLELAGDRAAAQYAHGAAESYYREVLERLERLGLERAATRVREKLGEVLQRAGKYDAALPVVEGAAEAYSRADDLEGLVRVTVRIGRLHAQRATPEEGITRITALLQHLDQGHTFSALAALYESLSVLLFVAGQYTESLAASDRAAELAHGCGDRRTEALAAVDRMGHLYMLGRVEEALRLSHEVLSLAEKVGDLSCLTRAHRDLAYIYILRGDFQTSRRHLDRALALVEHLGDPVERGAILLTDGLLAFLRGDWRTARANLEQATTLRPESDQAWYAPYPLSVVARFSLAEGDWRAAATSGQEAIALAEQSGDLQALRWVSTVMAELEILEGHPEVAASRLAPLLDRPGLEECDVTALLPVLAWAYLEQNKVDEAAEAVGQALARARREGMRLIVVEALRVQALIALRRERWDEAAHSLEEGLALARSLPYSFAEAQLLSLDGQRYAAQREVGPAREQLQAALTLFRRLGARKDAERVEQALDALSNGSPRHTAVSARHGELADSPACTRLSRPERQAWALDHLRTDGALSPRAYARALGVSVDTALLDLRELCDQGLVRAEGTTRDRCYLLADAGGRCGHSLNARRDSPNALSEAHTFGESDDAGP